MSCLISLDTLSWVVEQLVQGRALALLQGEVVEDLVSSVARVCGVNAGLHQDILRVQHLGHGQTVSKPLVHGGQGVLDRARRFQSLGFQFSSCKLQSLREELETPHVKKELLQSPLQRSVIVLRLSRCRGWQPCRLCESSQRCCLTPCHSNDGVH